MKKHSQKLNDDKHSTQNPDHPDNDYLYVYNNNNDNDEKRQSLLGAPEFVDRATESFQPDIVTTITIVAGSCFIIASLIVMFFLIRKNRGLSMLPSCIQKRQKIGSKIMKKYANMKMEKIRIENLSKYIEESRSKRELIAEFERLPDDDLAYCSEGSKPENASKNRFANILPYDETLVKLAPEDDDDDDDTEDNDGEDGTMKNSYINANFIKGYKNKSKAYIATQGPLQTTLGDFWRMVWQREVNIIIMLTPLVEYSLQKCYQYWPENTKDSKKYDSLSVTMETEESFNHYLSRKLLLRNLKYPDEQPRIIIQLHYVSWPDKSSPQNGLSLLNFISVARQQRHKQQKNQKQKLAPVLVHCSAGVGRTGTYIAIDYLLDQMIVESQVSIYNCVHSLRMQRLNMVQTQEQYDFIYDVINEASILFNTGVPCCDFLQHFCNKDGGFYYENYDGIDAKLKTIPQQFALLEKVKSLKTRSSGNIIYYNNNNKKSNDRNNLDVASVDGCKLMNEYSLTPTPSTDAVINDLWKFITSQRIKYVLLLENDPNSSKAFWPEKDSKLYGSNEVTIKSESNELECLTVRHFDVLDKANKYIKPIMVTHFELIGPVWKTGSRIPTNNNQLLKVIERMKLYSNASNDRYILICSDGYSRSGLMAAAMHMIDLMSVRKVVDPLLASQYVLIGRPQAISSIDQFQWLYSLASDYLQMSGNV